MNNACENTETSSSSSNLRQNDDSSFEYVQIDTDSDKERQYTFKANEENNSNQRNSDVSDDNNSNADKLNVNEEQFTDKCMTKLTSIETWKAIVDKLDSSNNLHDFMTFVESLHDGTIPMDNIVFLLMLERAKFGKLKNTCSMRYRNVTKIFWSIVYRLCKSTGLKFFSGGKNWGQVVSKESEKSRYEGKDSKINFAVPDEKMIREITSSLPKVIPPGIISKSLNLLRNRKDVVIMADGKLLSRGLGDNFTGDINLFGHETNPNLQKLQMELSKHLDFIADCINADEYISCLERFNRIAEISSLMAKLCNRIRLYIWNKYKKLQSYDSSNNQYTKFISKLKTEIYTASLWVRKCLRNNAQLLHLLADLQTNRNLFSTESPLSLDKLANIRLLHNADYIAEHVDSNDFPHLFKRGSDICNDMQRQTLIPAGDAFIMLGLDSLRTLKNKFKINITEEATASVEQITDYQPTVDALATTAAMFLPAYFPSCCLMYEEGIRILKGSVQGKLVSCCGHAVIRHHHGTQVSQLQCNARLHSQHQNCSLVLNTDPACFTNCLMSPKPDMKNAVKCILTMKILNVEQCIFVTISSNNVSFCRVNFDSTITNKIMESIAQFYDCLTPKMPSNISTMKAEFHPLIEQFIDLNCSVICELPRISATMNIRNPAGRFTAYTTPTLRLKHRSNILLEEEFELLASELSTVIEEGFNHLRVEASEILAFVATNPHRIQIKGIPPHLPIAYGLRGASMSTETMRSMISHILQECDDRNIGILCEVYDGQFHKLITRDKDNCPLTRLQFQQDFFKRIMNEFDKQELLRFILPYSSIDHEDLEYLLQNEIACGHTELQSISMDMAQRGRNKILTVRTIPIGNISMRHIQTKYRRNLWPKLLRATTCDRNTMSRNVQLTNYELHSLIRGSRYARFGRQQITDDMDYEESSDSDDPDYLPLEFQDDSTESDVDENFNITNISTITNTSTTSEGEYCITRILDTLQRLKPNKHKWMDHDVNSFIRNFLSSKANINKLFLYEMDVINKEIHDTFGKMIFQPKDKKNSRVNKIANQLKRIPNLFDWTEGTSTITLYSCLQLKDLCQNFVLSSVYPKEYLAAPYCEINHCEEIRKWERKSPIPIHLNTSEEDISHIVYNYPEINTERMKIEMRTFDYTHVLNNLRFHICNKGFGKIRTEAFLKISEDDNDVLPRAIVEDKLDRQNASISQRFFSEEVENALLKNNCNNEAEFVNITRHWFEACDTRGISAKTRLRNLTRMYHYLLNMYCFSNYPPETTHIQDLPIRTYEALLHTISSRFILYHLSEGHSYNNRAISTLAVESFFSDLNRFEFSGLGAPKSTDIPKLISHVVHINTTKHDPDRGFEFTTSTRDNYPCYMMEMEQNTDITEITDHPFDKTLKKRPKRKRKLDTLSKPTKVIRGMRGVREIFRINEAALTHEQRLGKNIDLSEIPL